MASLPKSSLTVLSDLLSIPGNERSEADLKRIESCLLGIQGFRELKDTGIRTALCRLVTVQTCPQHYVVFNLGTGIDRFCMLLAGKVIGKIPTSKLQKAYKKKEVTVGMTTETALTGLIDRVRLGQQGKRSPPRPRLLSEDPLTEFAVYSPGDALSELSLDENAKSELLVECEEESVLMNLLISDYAAAMREYDEKRVKEHVKLLREVPAFAKWTRKSLGWLIKSMQERRYLRGEVVYKEGDKAENVYIICNGEFRFCKHVGVGKREEREVEVLPSIRRLRHHSPVKPHSEVTILTKSARQLFGYMEIMEDCDRRFTCICLSRTAIVLELAKADFQRRTQNQDTWSILCRLAAAEKDLMQTMLSKLTSAEFSKQQISQSKPLRPRTPSEPSSMPPSLPLKHKRLASVLDSVNSSFAGPVSKSDFDVDQSRIFTSYRATPQPKVMLPRINQG